jgi:preprotein translocase subunit SecA
MAMPTDEYRKTDIRVPKPLLSGLDALVYGLAGSYKSRASVSAQLLREAEHIDRDASRWQGLSDETLQEALTEMRATFRRQKPGFENQVGDALGAVREAAHRSLGLRPYMVQLAGALALYRGNIAEMATGEGKTLTAGLAAVLWGWIGRPCHIITVNDYLAERDAKSLTPLYAFCGVSVGAVISTMAPSDRKENYDKEVTYTTSKEILADFLRDRLRLDTLQQAPRRQIRMLATGQYDSRLVMRGIHTAVVDEADSVLIDEAVTPLIISQTRQNDRFVEACQEARRIADTLKPGVDYRTDPRHKDIQLLPAFDSQLNERHTRMPRAYRSRGAYLDLVYQALKAKEFFHRDLQYVVQDREIVIVDEFTGRLMPQRTWNAGLHQIIQAREGLPVTAPSETLARLSFQRFFRFFQHLTGMTGTARESARELWQVYRLPVITIPQNVPSRQTILPRRLFLDQESKWTAIVEDIIERNRLGQPVLVGTRSVKASEMLASRLSERNTPCRVLNAVRHQTEARIVSHAGERGNITVATNMAGRGTDILLQDGVAQLGGLHVIATECHESRRIDRQLFGRSARQGDPGSACSYVSLEDELLCRYIPVSIRKAIQHALKQRISGADLSAEQAVRWAQNTAQRMAFKQRSSVLRTDTWLEDSLSFAHGDIE